MRDIWIWVQQRDGAIEEPTFGLVAEARRLLADGGGTVTAVAVGNVPEADLKGLGSFGVDRVLHFTGDSLTRYNGDLFAAMLARRAQADKPFCILFSADANADDLCPRLAALLEAPLVTRAMDFRLSDSGEARAVRPVGNGYLFEEVALNLETTAIVSFLPPVLFETTPNRETAAEIVSVTPDAASADLRIRVVQVIEAAPEDLDLEEADIIVTGGRGAGKGEAFDIIHELAKAIGGTVGATRPIIDWGTLPYERQIGQTGKYVSPKLIINCGISGANEYTAGMEKSQNVIAIDLNPRARIFRFADLGVIGDVHKILPPLIARLDALKHRQNKSS